MVDVIFTVLFLVGMVIFLIWSLSYSQKQGKEAQQQIIKLIEQIGGRQIEIKPHYLIGARGIFYFKVTYVDVDGQRCHHFVSRVVNAWGTLQGDFLWDKPLKTPNIVEGAFTSSSKEQIINDMDAEIKRLQEELRRAREESY